MVYGRWFGRAFAAILVVALVIALGAGLYRGGWNQGYLVGQLAGRVDGGTLPSAAMYGSPGLGLGASLGLILLGLLVAGLLGKMFVFQTWQAGGGPSGRSWTDQGHWKHRRYHCWDRPGDEREGEAPAQEEGAGRDKE